jgi:hypothetical protein
MSAWDNLVDSVVGFVVETADNVKPVVENAIAAVSSDLHDLSIEVGAFGENLFNDGEESNFDLEGWNDQFWAGYNTDEPPF